MRPAAGTVGLLLLAACAPAREPAAGWRWIESPPQHVLAPSDLHEIECRHRWAFAADAEGGGWRLVEGQRVEQGGSGITVRGGLLAPRLALAGAVARPAATAARVVVNGVRRGEVRLRWRAVRGAAGGTLALPKSAGSGALRDRFLFDLGALPAAGEVTLELEPTSAAGEVVTVSEVCVGGEGDRAGRLDAAARVPWKVAIGDEVRDVLLVPSAGEVARRGPLPGGGRLEFGVGLLAGSAAGLRIEVLRRDAPAAPLLRAELGPERLAAGWVDLAAELGLAAAPAAELVVRVVPVQASADFTAAVSAPRVIAPGRRDQRPNLVLVSIDTLRADTLSLYGYPRPTTPNLDAWARRHATVFRRAVAPSSWTLPSHFSLFTGLESFAHPANYNAISIDASAYHFLAEKLWRAGYRTAAITGGSFVAADFGLARGFESFRAWRAKERRDEELATHLPLAQRWLDGTGTEPFFLFLHTYEVHTPTGAREPWFSRFHGAPEQRVLDLGPPDPPRPEDGFLGSGHFVLRDRASGAAARLAPGQEGLARDFYDSAVAYVDDRLTPLLERLARPPFAGRTLVAVVSDHGESLGEGGRAGHTYLALDNLLIPMLVAGPGFRAGAEVGAQVRLHDLYATFLEAAGLPIEAGSDSRSVRELLAADAAGRTAFTYAAPTNRGLSVLAPDGLKVEWTNSPWRALAGGLRAWRVDGFTERPFAGRADDAEVRRRAEQLQAVYARRAPGLRVELVNPGPAAAAFELVTDLVDPVSVKVPDAAGAALDWVDVGRVRGELGPGGALRLHFERAPGREIALTASVRWASCRRPATAVVRGTPEALRAGRVESLKAGGCPVGSATPPLQLRVAWQGPAPDAQLRPGDERLQEELRALGYLN